jgi:amphi-Trp domain-containing protein
VSDVRVEQKQVLSREEAARFIAALADGLGGEGTATVRLGTSTLELSVADELRCELEVAVDGDGIELELELKWSTSARAVGDSAEGTSAAEESVDQDDESAEEDEPQEGDPVPNATARDDVDQGGSEEAAPESGDTDSEQTAVAEPAPRRRRASAKADKPALNGVDTAAVRAWAAAKGLSVPPRGRIKDEVIQAYREAGN